ncbi:MAG: class I SAM-dependent methyltransferase [bacterium]
MNLAKTDLFRLVHGEADGLPGMDIDRVGPVLRVTLTGAAAMPAFARSFTIRPTSTPTWVILENEHMRDIREGKKLPPQARIIRGRARYVKPGDLLDRARRMIFVIAGTVGRHRPNQFFADQRDNRRRLVELAQPGQTWLNLFCHTGAFSVALANKGVHVVSNDLSKRYLDWLDENLALNGIDASLNTNVPDDARNYLSAATQKFDGIIVDPPTAAQGDGFWSVRKGYNSLLEQCFRLLNPGGVMLVCRNDKKRGEPLDDLIDEAAGAAKRKITAIDNAPPASDYPVLEGFPEGTSFEGRLVFTK